MSKQGATGAATLEGLIEQKSFWVKQFRVVKTIDLEAHARDDAARAEGLKRFRAEILRHKKQGADFLEINWLLAEIDRLMGFEPKKVETQSRDAK